MSDTSAQNKESFPSPYVNPPALPTQAATDGILFDYCDGLRVKFPEHGGPWRLRVEEEESGLVSFDGLCQGGAFMATRKKWFCRHRLSIWRQNEIAPCFEHVFDATGKEVLIQMAVGTLGDSIAWLPAAVRFGEKHRCKVFLSVNPAIRELFAASYPDIRFITKEEADALCRLSDPRNKGQDENQKKINDFGCRRDGEPGKEPCPLPSFYASYRIGLFFNDEDNDLEPSDFRLCGLHHAASHILGVPESEEPPRLPKAKIAAIARPYVCIATKASMQCKFWNHPTGWVTVIDFLKKSGYRVLCIDRERDGAGVVPNPMPRGCEDFTGNFPLIERAEMIRHAAFFIGLPSGLSWLAWACGVPTVLIGGFSEALTEFATPYRVLTPHACHGCWNDRRFPFDHKDFMWCPRHKGTDRQFECTRLITPEQVIAVIKKIPAFRKNAESGEWKEGREESQRRREGQTPCSESYQST